MTDPRFPPSTRQEWAMTARVTISRRPLQQTDDVRMECSWDSPATATATAAATSPTFATASTASTARPCYGFQRGDITFSTRPAPPEGPGSYASLPSRRAAAQPYSRRCKSTCSITLAEVDGDDEEVTAHAHVARSNSLRASAQSVECVACGASRSPAAVRRGANFTTHFCTRLPDKGAGRAKSLSRDAASQTLDDRPPEGALVGGAREAGPEIAAGTEPAELPKKVSCADERTGLPRISTNDVLSVAREREVVSKNSTKVEQTVSKEVPKYVREDSRETVPKDVHTAAPREDSVPAAAKLTSTPSLLQVPSSDESATQPKGATRLARSPARIVGRSPLLRMPDTGAAARTRKPRTVHIDVYCTGSEASTGSSGSSATSSDSDSDASWSSPRTVFESERMRVTHTRAAKQQLPLAVQRRLAAGGSSLRAAPADRQERSTLRGRGYDSDDGLSSECTSRDPSSSTLSSAQSGCAFDGYDSAAATSCKDTEPDAQSRASLLSVDPSIAGSDSFEYADSSDRLRIRERERAWAAQDGDAEKSWRSPGTERKLALQQQRFKEFLEKRLGAAAFPLRKAAAAADESEDEGDSDETGDAWTFGTDSSPRACALKREDTVRRATPVQEAAPRRLTPAPVSRSPSPVKLRTSVMSPFTERAGLRTERLCCAERFGMMVGALRKPGHHVGPAKNPECGCAHCRSYCEAIGYRARTRSLDVTEETAGNWKAQLAAQLAQRGARKAEAAGEAWDSNEV